jgi:hypothetical protein
MVLLVLTLMLMVMMGSRLVGLSFLPDHLLLLLIPSPPC